MAVDPQALAAVDSEVRTQMVPQDRRNFIGFRELMLMRPPAAHGVAAQHGASAADRVRALKAQVDARRQAMIDSIASKMVYGVGAGGRSNVPSLSPRDLARAGISVASTAPVDGLPGLAALPIGLPIASLTEDERAYLGLPTGDLAGIYGGGP